MSTTEVSSAIQEPDMEPVLDTLSHLEDTDAALQVRHGFQVAELGFLIEPDCYAELINRPAICPIPDTPDCFLGFINHRGDTVPVFHLRRLFEPECDTQGRWLLLLDQGASIVALLLDRYPERLREEQLTALEAEESVPAEVASFTGEAYQRESQVWREFDHRQFCRVVRQRFNLR